MLKEVLFLMHIIMDGEWASETSPNPAYRTGRLSFVRRGNQTFEQRI